MTILFFMEEAAIGGVRTVTEILTKALEKRGHRVKWLMQYRYYNNDRDCPASFDCTYLPSRDLDSSETKEFLHGFIEKNKIDAIINQNGLYGANQFLHDNGASIPVYCVLHNNPLLSSEWLWRDILTLRDNSFKEKLKRIARIVLFKKVKRDILSLPSSQMAITEKLDIPVVTLSSRYIESVKKLNPNINQVVAIPNPNTYVGTIEPQPKEKIVLYVGRLYNKAKKINYLIKIWERIYKEVPDWKLLIVGEGPDKEILEKMAQGIDSIKFEGYQDPTSYYQKASILCMTSIFEGFPMVLTEAMQHGCVPIAFDSFPAVYDIIHSGEDGEIVKAFDFKAYGNGLLNLIKNQAYRKKLSSNAVNNVKAFDVDNVVKQWEDLFHSDLK